MLESDAKGKACMMAMGTSRDKGTGIEVTSCLGSHCMAWEPWVTPPVRKKDPDGNDLLRPGPGQTIADLYEPAKQRDPPQGHCGMIPPELNCERG